MSSERPAVPTLPAGTVAAEGVDKVFRYYPRPRDRVREWLSLGRSRGHRPITALEGIRFTLAPGRAMAVIGANGAGKSTLLRLVSGLLRPTRGSLTVSGRVASLLELGTGFLDDLPGRQNIFLNARFMGLSADEIRQRMPAILEFSELGEAVERPLRTYSSGMRLRLAFSVLAHVSADLLVIDEALAVGDMAFTAKCVERIRRFRRDGVSLLLASHDPGAVKALCDEAILLHQGRILDHGPPEPVWETYNESLSRQSRSRRLLEAEKTRRASAGAGRRFGSFRAVLGRVSLRDETGSECRSFVCGGEAVIEIESLFLDAIDDPTIGILIRDRHGVEVYGTNTHLQQRSAGRLERGQGLRAAFRLRLDLAPGDYTLTVAAHTHETHLREAFDWRDRALAFRMDAPPGGRCIGTTWLRPAITLERMPALAASSWAAALSDWLGREAPARLAMGVEQEAWLITGWHPPEEDEAGTFRWTSERCALVCDLRGEALVLEVASTPLRPGQATRMQVGILDAEEHETRIENDGAWREVRIPIPPRCRLQAGIVRIEAEAWRPGDAAGGADLRTLGLRVRGLRTEGAKPPAVAAGRHGDRADV